MERHGLRSKVNETAGPSPELAANLFSYCTWQWVQPFITHGNKKTIQAEDLYDLLPRETTEYCELQWNKNYETQMKTGNVSVSKLIFLTCGREMVWSFLVLPFWLTAVVVQVFLLRAFVQLAEDRSKPLQWWRAFLMVLGMLLTSNVQSLTLHRCFTAGQKSGMRIRSAVSMAVFNKLLQMRVVALGGTSSGQMLNLITNDTQKLLDAATYAGYTSFGVIDTLLVAGLGVREVGIAALPGVAIMFLAQFLQVGIAQAIGKMRTRSVKFTDARVRAIQEILSGVRVVKYNGWTTAFLSRIQKIRSAEIWWIRMAAFLRSSTSTLREGVALLAAIATFGTYVTLHSGNFSASKTFTILGLYSILVRAYAICPTGMQAAWESKVATQRLQRLLDLPTGKGFSSDEELEQIRKIYPHAPLVVSEGTFAWYLKDQEKTEVFSRVPVSINGSKSAVSISTLPHTNCMPSEGPDDQLSTTGLKYINLDVHEGQLVAVIGAVGAYKSSLLYAILGEMECLKGAVSNDLTVSYAPQQPWILNDTIQNNITFGSPYDEARYRQTIYACALDHDLRTMPAGDNTEIGERGVNLSVGQKVRISLARACYSLSKLLLLDDPLASVDVPTARHLMNHVLGGILTGRTVILVTHNKASLELCDRVFLMENGTLQEVELKTEGIEKVLFPEEEEELTSNKDFDTRFRKSQADIELERNYPEEGPMVENWEIPGQPTDDAPMTQRRNDSKQDGFAGDVAEAKNAAAAGELLGTLIVEEGRVVGEVTWASYIAYVKRSGLLLSGFVIFLMCFAQALRVMVDYWISIWVSFKYNLSTNMYLIVYAVWIGSFLVFNLARGLFFTEGTIQAAKSLHTLMAESVLRSPQLFFDQNPVGRILNRFSKDQSMVEELLPWTAQEMIETMVAVLGVMVFIAIIMPWFLLSLPLFIFILWYCQQRYVAVSRELRRLDGLSRSPIYEHFSQTLQGVASVRAYARQAAMRGHFRDCIDANNRAYILFVHTSHWLGIRLDFASAICVTTTALLAVLLRYSVSPGHIGVVLLQSLQLTDFFQWGVRLAAETENIFTSVERIQAFASLPSEADPKSPPGLITDKWPQEGDVEFVNYTMAYRVDLPPVLNNLTFKVHPQEKVGILGRTGVGKSSLVAALFRMVENSACSGSIFIDGVDLKLVGLDDLRLRLSIVPQDPVLFRGTVRLNLDPFERHSDVEIYEALAKVQLTSKIKSLKLGLSSTVAENGENFSVGQRQLFCLARSLLRRSRIIIMDEATAAVDGETDELIQKTVRSAFQNCTVLIIAHRINTVIDCDRVLVLGQGGRISEFDSPINLIRRAEEVNVSYDATTPEGHLFADMVSQSGSAIAQQLRAAAEAAEQKWLTRCEN